jgi:predicted acetyltransferase
MTDRYPIRPVGEDEFAAFYAVGEHAFNSGWPSEAVREHELVTFEFDRSLAAFDGPRPVGTACAYSFQMALPGAMAPVAGVSAVSVLPSYRRRGILSSLMRRQLADVADGNEAVAALFASEPGIYGRYGYGIASMHARLTVRRGEGRMDPLALANRDAAAADGDVQLRQAEPELARAELAKVHDQAVPGRPGMLARDDRWWQSALHDPDYWRQGASPLRCVIAEDAAGARGYALFSVNPSWNEHGIADGKLNLRELISLDPAATVALWADLLNRDLVDEVRARLRPADDPLLYLLADIRRARTQLNDGLWVRLVDLRRALTQRQYAREVDVVIEVTDELLPGNAGRWRLQAGAAAAGASCDRTSGPPDVVLPVQSLGAAYLGGTRLGALASAGLVAEVRPGAVAELSAAMSWDPPPWSPMIF